MSNFSERIREMVKLRQVVRTLDRAEYTYAGEARDRHADTHIGRAMGPAEDAVRRARGDSAFGGKRLLSDADMATAMRKPEEEYKRKAKKRDAERKAARRSENR